MIRVLAAAILAVLAGCGVDGPPSRPTDRPPESSGTNLTITGDARIGVTAKL